MRDFPIHSLGMDKWRENGHTLCTDRILCTGQQLVGCSSYIVASAGGARSQASHGIATRVNSHTGVSSAQLCCRPQQLQCTEDDSLLPAFPTKVRRPTVTEVLLSPLHLLSSQYILLLSLQLASLLCIWIESIARLFCTSARPVFPGISTTTSLLLPLPWLPANACSSYFCLLVKPFTCLEACHLWPILSPCIPPVLPASAIPMSRLPTQSCLPNHSFLTIFPIQPALHPYFCNALFPPVWKISDGNDPNWPP